MRGGGGDMGVRERAGVEARRHQAREMGHVDQQISAHAVGNRAHPGKVDHPRDGAAACDDHLGFVFAGQGLDLVVIQRQVLLAHAVLHGVEPLARLVRCGTVRQMAPGIQAHSQDGVAGLHERQEHPLVRLGPRVRLDVGKAAAKQRTGTLDRQGLGDVDELAPAVIALAGIALGIFVGHHAALRLHHGARDDVFAGDQFDLMALAAQLLRDRAEQFGVAHGEGVGEKAGIAVRGVHHGSSGQGDDRVSKPQPAPGKGLKATSAGPRAK